MGNEAGGEVADQGIAALELMERALALLDQRGGAQRAGIDLDLAICRLREILGLSASDRPLLDGEARWTPEIGQAPAPDDPDGGIQL